VALTVEVRVDLMDGRSCVGRLYRDDVRTVIGPRAGELLELGGAFERALLGPAPRRIHQVEHVAGTGALGHAPRLVVVLRASVPAEEVPRLRAEAERAGWTMPRLLRAANGPPL
jgi:hypothetical protein